MAIAQQLAILPMNASLTFCSSFIFRRVVVIVRWVTAERWIRWCGVLCNIKLSINWHWDENFEVRAQLLLTFDGGQKHELGMGVQPHDTSVNTDPMMWRVAQAHVLVAEVWGTLSVMFHLVLHPLPLAKRFLKHATSTIKMPFSSTPLNTS